jgi:hypothetical protein
MPEFYLHWIGIRMLKNWVFLKSGRKGGGEGKETFNF